MNTQPLQLLIVEDEAAHVEAIRRAFEQAGAKATIHAVGSLREYREWIATQPPDLALVDLNLPDGRAVEVLTQPLSDAPFPILVMTAFGTQQIVVEVMKAGALDYVVKSTETFVELPQKVERALREWTLIQQRKQAEQKLVALEQKTRAWLENSPVCTMVVDLDFNLQFMSTAGTKALQIDDVTLYYGMPYPFDFFPESFITKMTDIMNKAKATGEIVSQEAPALDINGHELWFHSTVVPVKDASGQIQYLMIVSVDTTERKQEEAHADMSREILQILNEPGNVEVSLGRVVAALKMRTGFEAVGIRLSACKDLPYFVQIGFSEDFLRTENSLVRPTAGGGVGHGPDGKVCMECICGLMLSGRSDPANLQYTASGSYWTNDSPALRLLPPGADPQHHPRNRCIHDGYASVMLLPISNHDRILGLLQFNDRRQDCFSLKMVENMESIANQIGLALQRQQAEAALLQSQRMLIETENLGHVGGWEIDIATQALTWSDAVYKIHELEVGFQPTVERATEFFTPGSRPMIEQALQRVIEYGETFDLELDIITAKGNLRRVHTIGHANPARSQVFGFLQDITASKRAEEENARLATAVEQAAETVLITDTQGTILYVNPAFEKTSGYTCAEVLGKNPRIFKSGKVDSEFYSRMWEVLAQGQVWKGRFTNRRKDGTFFEEEATISPIRDAQGAVINYVAVKRDVTREVQIENQFRQTQKMEAIGTLAGGIAHDFNNILASIFGNGYLLQQDTAGNSETQEYVNEILKAAIRARDLVSQILTFSRQRELSRQVIHLETVLKEATKFLRASLPTNIQIDMQLAADAPAVIADPTQIYQVTLNLATNALHAMANQPGRLTVALDLFQPTAAFLDAHAEFRPIAYARLLVADTGRGMDAHTLERIFDPFFTTKSVGQGTGLGLAVVHGIVQTYEGIITVTSAVGQGTTFSLYFPAQPNPVAVTAHAATKIPTGHGQRILLVDDETALTEVLKRFLVRLQYQVTVSNHAHEAVALFREDPAAFDLVITDLTMPEINGLEVARQLHAIRPDLPVILASGYTSELNSEELREARIFELLEKPVSPATMGAAVHRALA